jgi:hypothetical protein
LLYNESHPTSCCRAPRNRAGLITPRLA